MFELISQIWAFSQEAGKPGCIAPQSEGTRTCISPSSQPSPLSNQPTSKVVSSPLSKFPVQAELLHFTLNSHWIKCLENSGKVSSPLAARIQVRRHGLECGFPISQESALTTWLSG